MVPGGGLRRRVNPSTKNAVRGVGRVRSTGGVAIVRSAALAAARPLPLPLYAGPVLLFALVLHTAGPAPRPPGLELPIEPVTAAPRPGLARLLAFSQPPPRRATAIAPAAAASGPEAAVPEPGPPATVLPPPAVLLARESEIVPGRSLDGLPLFPPLPTLEVVSPFGPRPSPFTGLPSRHEGIDLRAPAGSLVRSAGAGRVVRAGREGPFGLLVVIDHGGGLTTRYAHLSRILVREGERVAAGRPIGRVGSSGRSTGPHLHYELRVAGEPVDPLRLLEAGLLLALARGGPASGVDEGPFQGYGPIGLGGEAEPPS